MGPCGAFTATGVPALSSLRYVAHLRHGVAVCGDNTPSIERRVDRKHRLDLVGLEDVAWETREL